MDRSWGRLRNQVLVHLGWAACLATMLLTGHTAGACPPDAPSPCPAAEANKCVEVVCRSSSSVINTTPKPILGCQETYEHAEFHNFDEKKIRLYYFTNVAELMHVLNPFSGIECYSVDPSTDPDAIAKDILTAESELTKAQQALNDERLKLTQGEESLRQLEADKAWNVVQKESAQRTLTTTLKDRSAEDKERKAVEESRDKAAEAITTTAEAIKVQTTANEKQAAVVKDKADAVDSARVALQFLRDKKTTAFAAKRDNSRLLCAYATSPDGSEDPLRRVFIYGFPDSNTIVLRGPKVDLKEAENLIRLFDQPSPQARVTLWTLELNSQATPKGARQMNDALAQVEAGFADCRMQIGGVQTVLRDCISDQARATDQREEAGGNDAGKYRFYDDVVLNHLRPTGYLIATNQGENVYGMTSANKASNDISVASELSPPAVLYAADQRLSQRAEVNSETQSNPQLTQGNVLHAHNGLEDYYGRLLPDPTNLPTLSEQLIALALASRDSRNAVMDDFECRLSRYLHDEVNKGKGKRLQLRFNRLRRAIGADCYAAEDRDPQDISKTGWPAETPGTNTETAVHPTLDGVSAQQQVLLTPFERYAAARLVRGIYDSMDLFEDEVDASINRSLSSEMINEWTNRSSAGVLDKTREALGIPCLSNPELNLQPSRAVYQSAQNECCLAAAGLATISGGRYPDYKSCIDQALAYISRGVFSERAMDSGVEVDPMLVYGSLLRLFKKDIGSRYSTLSDADVAKADDLLKQFNQAMEDELDEFFVQPMLADLRRQLMSQGVGVGVIQRTGLLTTNRMVARVEPRSSAELEFGLTEDYQDSARALFNLFGAAKVQGAATGKVQDVINSMFDPINAEVYGLRAGSEFKITPIFDPSGQALRFKFDYNYANVLSGGSNSPALPRVEHVGVNLEAQLSNFEIRELTRYETNVKLGIEKKRSGGLPLLKDMPLLKDIPFVGYFQKTRGSAAVTQEHLIFAQTSMYPTVVDIIRIFNNVDPELMDIFSDLGSPAPTQLVELLTQVYEEPPSE